MTWFVQLAIAGTAASIATALAPAAQAAQEVAMTAEVRPLGSISTSQ